MYRCWCIPLLEGGRKVRSFVVFGVLVGALVLGASVAYGKWWWNSEIDVEGSSLRTEWRVVGDPKGANNYDAEILVSLPEGALAEVVSLAPNESVVVRSDNILECRSDGIEAVITYDVEPTDGAKGSRVKVSVTVDGELVGKESGRVGDPISLGVIIPALCSGTGG